MRVPVGMFDGNAGLNKGHAFIDPATGTPLSLDELLAAEGASFASISAAQAITEAYWFGRIEVAGKTYVWRPSSVANDTTGQVAIRPSALGASDPGRFERASESFCLQLPFTFATADGAALFTVPTGWRLLVNRPFYDVSISFTGGTGSTIGVSSSNTVYSTKGDILGGAAGDAAANLTAGFRAGTIGTDIASQGIVVLIVNDTIRHDRITSVFTAGAATLIVPVVRAA